MYVCPHATASDQTHKLQLLMKKERKKERKEKT
jgi:hypothetical protein